MLSLGNLPLHHIAIKVSQLEACEKFYHRLLGLKVVEHQHDARGAVRAIWLESGAVTLMLEKCKAGKRRKSDEAAGLHLIAFAISRRDRQEWRERLQLQGVVLEHESDFSLYFRDPEGNRIALSHYPESIHEAA